MGFILKIVIFGVAAYTIWKTANRWFNLLGGNRPPTAAAPPPPPVRPMQGSRVEDTHPCPGCGTYISVSAAKCGRPDCPQT